MIASVTVPNSYDVRVTAPQIDDPRHPAASEALNRSILERFAEKQVDAQPLPGSAGHFDGAATAHEDGGLVALTLSIDSYSGGAHPNTELETVLYDADRGREVQLEDLFIDKKGYLQTLSQEVSGALAAQPDVDETFVAMHTEARPENFAAFEPSAQGMTFLMPASRVGPYNAGLFEATLSWDRLRPALDPTGPLWREASDFDFAAHPARARSFERLAALRGPVGKEDPKHLPQAPDAALDLLAVVGAAQGKEIEVPALTEQFVRLQQALVALDRGDEARSTFEGIETGLRQGSFGSRTREEVTRSVLQALALGSSPATAVGNLEALPGGVPSTIQRGDGSVTIGGVTLPARSA